MVDFILRRARDIELVHVYPAGAATRACQGERMAELGLMREAGAVYFTDADRPIANSKVLRRVLSYAKGFGAAVAHRPADPYLSQGAVATDNEITQITAYLARSFPNQARKEVNTRKEDK